MTIHEIINAALSRLSIPDPSAEEANGALVTLNNNLSNFIYWKESDVPGLPFALDTVSPFPDYYNEAIIIKVALKEAVKYPIPALQLQSLAGEDANNMARLHYRESLGRVGKPSTSVI